MRDRVLAVIMVNFMIIKSTDSEKMDLVDVMELMANPVHTQIARNVQEISNR